MMPDERREAIGYTATTGYTRRYFKDTIRNSNGDCVHGLPLSIRCDDCADMEQHERDLQPAVFCPGCGACVNVNGTDAESHRVGCYIGRWRQGQRPQHGIGSFEWFRRESAPLPGIEQVRLEDDPLYQRHTVEITEHPISIRDSAHVNDEMSLSRGVLLAWAVMALLVASYVVWRWLHG